MSSKFKVLYFFIVALLIFTAVFLFIRKKMDVTERMAELVLIGEKKTAVENKQTEEVHFQAKFIVFTNGTKRIFSDSKYHNRSEEVYITSDRPETIYVKNSGITWGDFFNSLPSPMKVENSCLYTGTGQVFCNSESHNLKFFLNGEKVDQVLGQEIKNGDKLLISFGLKDEDITEQIEAFNRP